MIKYVNGDIFKGKEDVIVHGCNCFCNMKSGVAALVRKYYIEAVNEDLKTIKGDKLKLGNYSHITTKHIFYPERYITVVNAYTQYHYGTDRIQVDYGAIEKVFTKIIKEFDEMSIATVKIGCGLAGGDWNIVEEILNNVSKEKEIVVYIL